MLCAGAVPVLIALIGSFGLAAADLFLRIAAIILSIVGTACHAMEDAYDWRSQAAIRSRSLTRMRQLFDAYCVLAGELFEAVEPTNSRIAVRRGPPQQTDADSYEQPQQHSGANLRKYVVQFGILEDQCSTSLAVLHDRSNMA